MMKHFLLCLRGSQGVTIAFFDCIGRCVGTAPPTPRFAASICGFHRSGLRWFSPLGVAFASEIAARRVDASARRVGLRAHGFRFSACAASGLPLGGLAFGLTASAFRHAPLRSCPRRVGASAFRFGVCHSAGWRFRLPLRGCPRRVGASTFRFGVALVGLVLPPSASAFAARRVGLGLTASAFRHAPLRSCPRRVGLRAHCFRFSARADSEWPLGGWPSGFRFRFSACTASEIAFGGLSSSAFRFGVAVRRVGLRAHCFRFSVCTDSEWPLGELVLLPSASEIAAGRVGLRVHCFRFSACTDSEIALGGLVLPLGGLAFGLTASAFRYAPLRRLPSAGWRFRLPLPLFGMRRSAPPHR